MSKLAEYQVTKCIGKYTNSWYISHESNHPLSIGKGTYCSVNQVINKNDGKKYALKVVKFHESTSEREKDNALAEVRYLASV